ncbi:MAG: L-2-amino-thiazoline-4-carboxylic acid hydrolase [Clostridia bacterium]|nr:L-2-amino-thiazoline-4-carboxylic acid hydrolase [Clostridia bacterium]
MKYIGIYWTLFAPKIKKSITKRYGKDLAKQAIKQGRHEYKNLLASADDLGKGNPMAMNAYFAYVFAGAWLGADKKISPDGMADVMTDVLTSQPLKFYFGLTDLNSKCGEKKWERDMKKYAAWYEKNKETYPVNWVVNFDETAHEQGSYYYFTRCPICEFCARAGISELMPALCSTDKIMFELQHGKLYREHTLASGGAVCDYWIVGDKVNEPR